MAFFKFRKGSDEHSTPAPAPESVEAMRTRAKHRLIGASVLVLVGVIGFPLLFDSQPRPVSVDIAIEIPDKNKIKPPSGIPASTPASSVIVEQEPVVAAMPPTAPAVASAPAALPAVVPIARAAPVVTPSVSVVAKPVIKAPIRVDDGAKAQALLEGKYADKPAAAGASRFVVQVGAFSDGAKAHEARIKLEKAGLKTYTQVVQSKEGKRIRVRIGPFETKAEADKAAEKIRKLDLPAAILEL